MAPELQAQLRQLPAGYDGPTRKTRGINMDLVNNVDQSQVADMTFGILNYLQNRKDFRDTGAQLVAIAAMFKTVAYVFRVNPQELAQVASNVVTDADGRYIPEFKAIAMYIENEVRG